jgi:hypothetical protein
VSKRKDASYRSGLRSGWIKAKKATTGRGGGCLKSADRPLYNLAGVGEGCAMLLVAIALLVLQVPTVAQAEPRFPLLIGNQAYCRSVGILKNPCNDISVDAAAPGMRDPKITVSALDR